MFKELRTYIMEYGVKRTAEHANIEIDRLLDFLENEGEVDLDEIDKICTALNLELVKTEEKCISINGQDYNVLDLIKGKRDV